MTGERLTFLGQTIDRDVNPELYDRTLDYFDRKALFDAAPAQDFFPSCAAEDEFYREYQALRDEWRACLKDKP